MAREDSSAGENQFELARRRQASRRLPSARHDHGAGVALRRNRNSQDYADKPKKKRRRWTDRVTCDHPLAPGGEKNIALSRRASGDAVGQKLAAVHIHIRKHIPVGRDWGEVAPTRRRH